MGAFYKPRDNHTFNFFSNTIEHGFKNRQNKNQLGFKNQITNDQLDQISFKNCQDKNNLTLRTKMIVTKNVLKVKFHRISQNDMTNEHQQ